MAFNLDVNEGVGKQVNAFLRQALKSPTVLTLLGIVAVLLLRNHYDQQAHDAKEILLMQSKENLEQEYRGTLRSRDSFYQSLYFQNMNLQEKYRQSMVDLNMCRGRENATIRRLVTSKGK